MSSSAISTQNKRGEWVPAIPLPLYGVAHVRCGHRDCLANAGVFGLRSVFLTERRYREHYALAHVLGLS